jgi:hypothetical protein
MMRFIRIDAADLIRESMRQETDLADKLEHGKLDGEAFGAGEHQVDAPARGITITRLTAPPARGCSSAAGELEDLELLDVEAFGAGEHQVDAPAQGIIRLTSPARGSTRSTAARKRIPQEGEESRGRLNHEQIRNIPKRDKRS